MNRTDTTYKKVKFIGGEKNTKEKNTKIPQCKIHSLLEQKKQKQNIISQLEALINYLEELKINEKSCDKIKHNNEKIVYYKELIVFYKKETKNICNTLKSKCSHIFVRDSVDITPDESQTIIYCEKCETTF